MSVQSARVMPPARPPPLRPVRCVSTLMMCHAHETRRVRTAAVVVAGTLIGAEHALTRFDYHTYSAAQMANQQAAAAAPEKKTAMHFLSQNRYYVVGTRRAGG